MQKKKGIALLITLMFIMAITLSIGVGLSYTKRAQNTLSDESFLFQTSIILNDVLTLLKNSEELKLVAKDETGDAFDIFLAQSSFIPFESSGIAITLEIKSARSKFNPSAILDKDPSKKATKISLLRGYFSRKMVNNAFVDILLDGLGGVKDDLSYNSDIFNTHENLFRDYIVNKEHFAEFKKFYTNSFYDNALSKVDFDNLFYYGSDVNASYTVDLNYASRETWELLLGVDALRAEEIALGAGTYSTDNKAPLSEDELKVLANFQTSYTPQMYLDVKVEIMQNKTSAKIAFEYDIAKQKGYNFSYEI